MNIDMNNIATYLGCVVLVGFVFYVMTNMLSINNKVIEGLTSSSSSQQTPEKLLEALKNTKQNLVDNLHVEKYKTQYSMYDEMGTNVDLPTTGNFTEPYGFNGTTHNNLFIAGKKLALAIEISTLYTPNFGLI